MIFILLWVPRVAPGIFSLGRRKVESVQPISTRTKIIWFSCTICALGLLSSRNKYKCMFANAALLYEYVGVGFWISSQCNFFFDLAKKEIAKKITLSPAMVCHTTALYTYSNVLVYNTYCNSLKFLVIHSICLTPFIVQKRNCAVTVPIPTFMFLCTICIFPRSVCIFCCRKIGDRSWEYINRLQTHGCENWDWGRAVPFLGIHKSKFLSSACLSNSSSLPLINLGQWRKKRLFAPWDWNKIFFFLTVKDSRETIPFLSQFDIQLSTYNILNLKTQSLYPKFTNLSSLYVHPKWLLKWLLSAGRSPKVSA